MKLLTRAGYAGLFICAAMVFVACGGSQSSSETTISETETTIAATTYPVTAGGVTLQAQQAHPERAAV